MPAYKDKSGRWRYRFSVEGKRYSGSAPVGNNTKAVATELERAHAAKVARRQFTGVMPTVAQFAQQFLDHQRARVGVLTHENQEIHVLQHVVPRLGKLKLDDLTTRHLDELVTEWMAKPTAPRTINVRIDTLRRMLSLAVEWRLIDRSPTVDKVKVAKEAPRFLSEDEARRLLAAAGAEWRSMFLVGLKTGMRIGELRGLQWGDIDFHRRTVTIRRTNPGRPNLAATAPKGKRERVVPMTGDVFACLGELARALPGGVAIGAWDKVHVWPGLVRPGKERADARRVAARAQQARSATGCFTALVGAAKRAQVPDVGPHTLRHTYASWLVMRGVSLRVVQELLGHATMRQTEVYAHLAPGFAHHAAVQALDLPLVAAQAPALPEPSEP